MTILGATYLLIGLAFVFTLPRPKHLVGQKSKASISDFAKLFRNANLLAVYGVAAAVMGRLADKVGKLSTADKARISAGYMLVYYVGASVVGTAGGKFLKAFDWTGVALFMTAVLSIALVLSVKLLRST